MSNHFRMLAGCVFLALSFAACRTPKTNLNYFSADQRDSSHTRIWQSYEARIQPGDRISITVSALNPQSAQIFSPAPGGGPFVYTVDSKGGIYFPQLGFINVQGLTKGELRDTMLQKISPLLSDPVVNIEIIGLKVTILGEVNRQGPIPLTEKGMSILEAIGAAGDIGLEGKRDSVLVIRENKESREFGYINLLSNDAFKSPFFLLRQNDVVYVPMQRRKALVSEREQKPLNLSMVATILSIVTTIGFLILNFTR